MRREVLLGCGIVSSLLYVAANLVRARRWRGYSLSSQTVSELSAMGEGSGTDTMHIIFTSVNSLLILSAIGTGSTAFGTRFRWLDGSCAPRSRGERRRPPAR